MASLPVMVVLATFGAAESYDSMSRGAESVSNLGRFLEKYLGDCLQSDADFDRKGCESQAEDFRKQKRGRPFRFEAEDLEDKVAFGGWDAKRGAYRVLFTPFFSGRELALTVGKPHPRKGDGLPSVSNVPIWVKMPDGESELSFKTTLERGMFRVELIVVPQSTWALRRKGGDGFFRGVDAKLKGIRLYELRSEKVLAEQTYP